jgi:hypothetical protein
MHCMHMRAVYDQRAPVSGVNRAGSCSRGRRR